MITNTAAGQYRSDQGSRTAEPAIYSVVDSANQPAVFHHDKPPGIAKCVPIPLDGWIGIFAMCPACLEYVLYEICLFTVLGKTAQNPINSLSNRGSAA